MTTEYLAKIEGHGKLKIDFKKGRAKLIIAESERLFEGLLLGRRMEDAPYVTSRICGVCPTAHYLAALKALENALEVRPSQLTVLLRRLMLLSQLVQSHTFHLFFLALPDYLNVENALDIVKKSPSQFHAVLNIRKTIEKILETIGGRSIHPITPVIGGFSKYPTADELKALKNEVSSVLDEAIDFAEFFTRLDYPELRLKTQYLALANFENAAACQLPSNQFIASDFRRILAEKYPLYNGLIISSEGGCFEPSDYKNQIQEKIISDSPAKKGYYRGERMLAGAIARVNLNHNQLNPLAKEILTVSKLNPVASYNIFSNIVSQAIEVAHAFEEMLFVFEEILDRTEDGQFAAEKAGFSLPQSSSKWGVGAIEAPRGTLYHAYEITSEGKIKNADIVTPTVQNFSNLEADANQLLKINSHRSQAEQQKLVEMLIRAYDPCITCSVH